MSPLTTHDSRLTTWLRQLFGMPDYAAYLVHMRERHPAEQPLDQAAFLTDYLERRYADGPNRCC